MPKPVPTVWPRSLQGQMLFAIALALLLAQAIGAALLYRAQTERREAQIAMAGGLRLVAAAQEYGLAGPGRHESRIRVDGAGGRLWRIDLTSDDPLLPDDDRRPDSEKQMREILHAHSIPIAQLIVVQRDPAADGKDARFDHYRGRGAHARADLPPPNHLVISALQVQAGGPWIVVRQPIRQSNRQIWAPLLGQTLLTYILLVGAIALILRRITRPLAALTRRTKQFARTRDTAGQLVPEGPDDVRGLIVAHNAMEASIAGLLNEKDVMLGAIGHDLKTPLAALRVRIESVEDESERAKMAATIEDIATSLDDMLSLARVGRASEPTEPAELSALVGSVVEEFEDLGEPVKFDPAPRIVVHARPTWLRRALRNLIGNAVRYGKTARVSVMDDGGYAVIRIEDDGPGIPDDQIIAMFEPFRRGEPSRNSGTGGAGLGLTLARAIADQHGGTLMLANRCNGDGTVAGLIATLRIRA